MTEFNDIDDLFQKNKSDWNSPPKMATWEALSSRLEGHSLQQAHTRKNRLRWLGAACIVALLGIAVFFINQNILPKSSLATIEDVQFPHLNNTTTPLSDAANPLRSAPPSNANMVNQNKAIGSSFDIEKSTTTPKEARINLKATEETGAAGANVNTPSASAPIAIPSSFSNALSDRFFDADEKVSDAADTNITSVDIALNEQYDLNDQLSTLKFSESTVYTNRVGPTGALLELLQEGEQPLIHKIAQVVARERGVVIQLAIGILGGRPAVPAVGHLQDRGVAVPLKQGHGGPVVLQAVEVFEEQQPGGLLGVVELGAAARLLAQTIVYK